MRIGMPSTSPSSNIDPTRGHHSASGAPYPVQVPTGGGGGGGGGGGQL
jgi:hypothetical protein